MSNHRVDSLSWPEMPERELALRLLQELGPHLDWNKVQATASPWVTAARHNPPHVWAMERLLQEFPIHSAEGLALMHLAEALLRIPDLETATTLLGDQLNESFETLFTRHWLPSDAAETPLNLPQRLGARTLVQAARRALQLMGQQFVLGQNMAQAMQRAAQLQTRQSPLRLSYDMLGEGARTQRDAAQHLEHYRAALNALGQQPMAEPRLTPQQRDGMSIKLSALHPRFEAVQGERVMQELLPQLWGLCEQAAAAQVPLTIDAEESERLELTLEVFEALAEKVAGHCPQWTGLGLVIQAYQVRARQVVDHVIELARHHRLRIMVRLVKGAYWDSEIKRAQELGLQAYPVFTHKAHTDLCYLACARALLAAPDAVFPQWATHNAATIAAVLALSPHGEHSEPADFEMQRLHGMGEGIYRELARTHPQIPVRLYAPVGEHQDLLAYLVRRLLENGANSSFVHLLHDTHVPPSFLLESPLQLAEEAALPLPGEIFKPRCNSCGLDLSRSEVRRDVMNAFQHAMPHPIDLYDVRNLEADMARARQSQPAWEIAGVSERTRILLLAADQLEHDLPHYASLLVKEARKTWPDALAEVREAVDYLRYYSEQATALMQDLTLPAPAPCQAHQPMGHGGSGITGESNLLRHVPRGVWVCISPWNFPLAIFLGQVSAALVTGNTVLAKPAEPTPFVASAVVSLLHSCGVPSDVLQLMHGPGTSLGAALVAHSGVAGVAFTGSTATAKRIHQALASKSGPITPLIAETGGINAMLVDSTALPEQVVDAVVHSAFRSAGQRCSALRLLCLHEAIAQPVLDMLQGACEELQTGDPSDTATDIGPLIDTTAFEQINRYLLDHPASQAWGRVSRSDAPDLLAPHMLEVKTVAQVDEEVFGPVLHVLRWNGSAHAVIDAINAMGHGLTFGIQTRIESRARDWANRIRAGNVYVNRPMVGATVGLQPFGGQGLSGTGPKAGGPHYLQQFCTEQTVSINTAAASGNVNLLAGRGSEDPDGSR